MLNRLWPVFTFLVIAMTQANEDAAPQYAVNKINDRVYVLTELWNGDNNGNAGVLITEKGVLLVGTLMTKSAPALEHQLKLITDKPVRYVINIDSDPYNHHANRYFAERGATIISHENMRYEKAYSELLVNDQLTMQFGNETVKICHSPAHQLNHIDVFFETSNVLFMSDGYKAHWLTSHGPNGLKGLLDTFDKAIALADDKTVIVTGNTSKNPDFYLSNKKTLLKIRQKHIAYTHRIGELFNEGQTAKEIAKDEIINRLLADFDLYPKAKQWLSEDIELVIETDFTKPFPLSLDTLQHYVGVYALADGTQIEVLMKNERIFARSENAFMFELLPLSKEVFDFKGTLGQNNLLFGVESNGMVTSLTTRLEEDGWWSSRIKAGTHKRIRH
ncbi:MBL fold metallo-hydrolase [Pseudoalteromonas xiamenensis]